MQECDLVMKGGITSGVVYPHVLTQLATDYRLRNIGGTSAGAIAAVFAAAAEYRRQQNSGDAAGFAEIGQIADQLAGSMGSMFQPARPFAPLFELMLAAVSEKARTNGKAAVLTMAVVHAFRGEMAAGLIVLAAGILTAWFAGNAWIAISGILAAIALVVVLVATRLSRIVTHELPAHDFGLCSGRTLGDPASPGFSDWIGQSIAQISGKRGDPLTVGDLAKHDITVATMTTDLSSGRPYQLPLKTRIHYFSRAEFARLFDENHLAFLCTHGAPHTSLDPAAPHDLYQLPVGDDFPVLLVARMSLSFPGLIFGVPLWRYDDELKIAPGASSAMRRCLFSDGGISSNFPIHFFDAPFPRRPTFGIALGPWEQGRHGNKRIHLGTRGRSTTGLAVREIGSLGSFLSAILSTAKDWQDTMQSLLPGYAERIVTIRLDEAREGGMNLAMDRATIETLSGYGREAGRALRERFSYAIGGTGFDQHRYNRAISLLPELEEASESFAAAINASPEGVTGALTVSKVLTAFKTDHYDCGAVWRQKSFLPFANRFAELHVPPKADDGTTIPRLRDCDKLPSIDATIRLVVQADRQPKQAD